MNSLWHDTEAARCNSELALRAYSSRLVGGDPALVLHGGGNTSIKLEQDGKRVLYVKATGSDLARVDEHAFTPLWLDDLHRLLERGTLSNIEMMAAFDACLARRAAARPSIETLMHAALPFRCVEHTHADAVLAAMNVENVGAVHAEVYGDLAPLVPYQHSGHALARACQAVFNAHATPRSVGLILAFHGVVAFGDDMRGAYENMVELVTRAEHYLKAHGTWQPAPHTVRVSDTVPQALHAQIHAAAGKCLSLLALDEPVCAAYAQRTDLAEISQQGPATPQHAVYTRRVPLIGDDVPAYVEYYRAYLDTHLGHAASASMDAAPRIVVLPALGVYALGATAREAQIAADMYAHDIAVITAATTHGRYRSAPPAAIALAEFEYGGYAARLGARA